MRYFLLVRLLLLGSLHPRLSVAQPDPRPAAAPPALTAGTRQDTVQALHRYFALHRQSGKHLAGAGLLTIPLAAVITLGQALTSAGANNNTGEVGSVLVNLGLLGAWRPACIYGSGFAGRRNEPW
ncbi:hypothetical protein [Hymenobacter radiodurans]|uniref:hypothetical protein n=1 Tax=Hymenobacter radiodurans TaxID=2496028 RepID=UPI001058521E|nr:hypothetical protein [Hymenobacter radiodurans]